jgi:hypothetical protein
MLARKSLNPAIEKARKKRSAGAASLRGEGFHTSFSMIQSQITQSHIAENSR